MQPMVNETTTSAVDGGADAAAAIMSDHHYMLHFEYVDGKLEHRQIVGILRLSEIGHIAVYEQLARVEANYRIRRHAAIGVFFFFQAEDGIRDLTVTGVQTCALPI